MIEPESTFHERVNMLEGFKHLAITYFDLEFESTFELYSFATRYIHIDPDFIEPVMSMDVSDDDFSVIEPNNWGPVGDRYFSQREAEQINAAFAIKTGDLEWLELNMFNPNTTTTPWLYYNYALFKHVFIWLLPNFPTNSKPFNATLCNLLANVHTINDMFYHWAWYVFPRIMEHFTFVHESIEFLIEAAVTINLKEHIWAI